MDEVADQIETETPRLVRVATKSTLHEQPDDLAYWLGVPMSERVAAVEILRQRVFGGVH
jgi:hypothetical protein